MSTPAKTLFATLTYVLFFFLLAALSYAQPPEALGERAAKYHGVLKKRPGSGYLFERFYNAWLDSGSLKGLQAFLVAENEKPDRSTADALLLGLFHARQGNDLLALQTLTQALIATTRDPYRQVMRQLRVGDIYQRLRNRDEALAAYEAALQRTGSDTWIEKEILAQIEQVFRREDDLTGLARYLETLDPAEAPLRPALIERRARVLGEIKETA